jgi:hypothetical protein
LAGFVGLFGASVKQFSSWDNNDPKAATRAKRRLNSVPTSVVPGGNDASRSHTRKEQAMKILGTFLIAGMVLAPLTAFGLSADANYCLLLADLNRASDDSPNMDAAVREAINQCNKGNTAAAIPVLERALVDANVTLPPRK